MAERVAQRITAVTHVKAAVFTLGVVEVSVITPSPAHFSPTATFGYGEVRISPNREVAICVKRNGLVDRVFYPLGGRLSDEVNGYGGEGCVMPATLNGRQNLALTNLKQPLQVPEAAVVTTAAFRAITNVAVVYSVSD